MAYLDAPSTVGFNADAALDVALDVTDGPVHSFVEYNQETFTILYVSDSTLEQYEDREQMLSHFEEIHSYVHVDVVEHGLFTENLFPIAEEVRYMATAMDFLTVVRIYVGDEGLFLAVDPDENVQPLVAAIRDAIGNDID